MYSDLESKYKLYIYKSIETFHETEIYLSVLTVKKFRHSHAQFRTGVYFLDLIEAKTLAI